MWQVEEPRQLVMCDHCDREKVMEMCTVRIAGRHDRALGIEEGAKEGEASGWDG